jgi:hypothetical protein
VAVVIEISDNKVTTWNKLPRPGLGKRGVERPISFSITEINLDA